MPWFWWLGVIVLTIVFLALCAQCVIGWIEVGRANQLANQLAGIRYYCCDHCGLNFPEVGQSICEREPNCHKEPCNEPGFCRGKEVVL